MNRIQQATSCALVAMACMAPLAAYADHQHLVQDVIVNIGVVPYARVAPTEGARHGATVPSGAQHVLVSVADAKSGHHVSDARVDVEIVDPKGAVQRKHMAAADTGHITDYSEIFVFGWSGRYHIRVTIDRPDHKPIETEFIWTHTV